MFSSSRKMPLPAALLARLQRRGIVKSAGNEEVIAENYDAAGEEKEKKQKEERDYALGCPNKSNPYHVCVDFCYDHWREGYPENRLPEEYHRRRKRMLTRYPLPEGWVEVYDSGLRRHYYWNPDTDEVCWLSPRHPGANIGEAAPKMAKDIYAQLSVGEKEDIPLPPQAPRGDRESDKKSDSRDKGRKRKASTGSESESEEDEKKKEEVSDRDRLRRAQRKGIDPMDPAAYSDIRVGKWSSGLREETKTGVDVTAGVPLFQQRPYPAPGAILRAQKKREEEDD